MITCSTLSARELKLQRGLRLPIRLTTAPSVSDELLYLAEQQFSKSLVDITRRSTWGGGALRSAAFTEATCTPLFFCVSAAPASVIAAPAIEPACCVTYLEYYETPSGEHTPVRERGVLKHARCFDSPPVLHITPEHLHRVCCAKPPNTPLPPPPPLPTAGS